MTMIVRPARPGAAIHQYKVPVVREVPPAPVPPGPVTW
jgi:hypothetical protein